jgi:hypothetical protein
MLDQLAQSITISGIKEGFGIDRACHDLQLRLDCPGRDRFFIQGNF